MGGTRLTLAQQDKDCPHLPLLSKPFDDERLMTAINRAVSRFQDAS